MSRFLKSCKRLTLPSFDKGELLECIKEFVKLEERWIPSERGYSLYLRPTAIATQSSLGVGPSSKAKIFLIASPVGPYYKTGFSAVSLFASTEYVRAWPGICFLRRRNWRCQGWRVLCTNDSNYAPGIRPQIEVAKEGFAQILWLFGPDHCITEGNWTNPSRDNELFYGLLFWP